MDWMRRRWGRRGAAQVSRALWALAAAGVFALLAGLLFHGGPPRALDAARPAAAGTPAPTPTPYFSNGPTGIMWVH